MGAKIVSCKWCGKNVPENNPVHSCNRSDIEKIYPALPDMLRVRDQVIVSREDLELLCLFVCENAPEDLETKASDIARKYLLTQDEKKDENAV